MYSIVLQCNLLIRFHLLFLVGFASSEGSTTSECRYTRMRQLFPQLQNSAPNWRMAAENDYEFRYHPCKRNCNANVTMTCYYYFIVHYDDTMSTSCDRYLQSQYRFKYNGKEYIDSSAVHKSNNQYDDCKYADGVPTQVMVINGRLPGQKIEVCEGDTIVVDVINSMHESTTLHWHGIHNRATPHMDGVPHITQYPIEAGQAFRYRFEVDHAGTHWWHSHTDHQRAYGLAGALVARQPDTRNVHKKLYDFDLSEHTIMLQDWVYDYDESVPMNLLINGLGRKTKLREDLKAHERPTLYAEFDVVRGGRYRFRVIFNGITNCPVSLSIDQHDLVVIASDGNDIEPVVVQKITFFGGERYDFVLHANQDVANYWIRLKGDSFCAINRLHQEAVLRYNGADRHSMPVGGGQPSYDYERRGMELNPISLGPQESDGGEDYITISQLTSKPKRLEPAWSLQHIYYTTMSTQQRGENLLFQMDDISFSMPKFSFLQTRNLGIGKFFCNKTSLAQKGFNCRSRHCKCANIIEVPASKQVEFVVSSTTASAHPIHLHGYTFRVVGMGILGEKRIHQIEDIDRRNPLPRRVVGVPLKDTVQIPAFGYTIFRIYTDSPGYWIFHCHISTHSERGMAAVVRVGDDKQMKMCPVSNCGLCNSLF